MGRRWGLAMAATVLLRAAAAQEGSTAPAATTATAQQGSAEPAAASPAPVPPAGAAAPIASPPEEEPGPTFPLFLPDAKQSSKLVVQQAGLDFLASIKGRVALVAAIGPYRTGKSYLLNQLMGVSCARGFAVGNLRSTNTQGIWLWGEPELVRHGDEEISVVFMDTEGMEGTGRTSVYDDRIFALASLLSSVLIYNLPETVKESDIQKLSFAVELSEEFYRRLGNKQSGVAAEAQFAFPTLIWLIQRDFLEGEEVQQHIAEVLAPVANTAGDPHVDELNRIRHSLQVFKQIGTGLRQPHLDRTRLCELPDSALDPRYLSQRDALKRSVREKVSPKLIASVAVDGAGLADFAAKCGPALNEKDIPAVGSVIDVFNAQLVSRALARYAELEEGGRALPLSEEALEAQHKAAKSAALELFSSEQFGVGGDGPVLEGVQKAFAAQQERNKFASLSACDSVYNDCDNAVGLATEQYLLSKVKFERIFRGCNTSFAERCVGPSQVVFQKRLDSSWARSSARFAHEYHERILGVVLTACLGGAVLFRFILPQPLLELLCWVGLGALEIVPRLTAISTMSSQDHAAVFGTTWWLWVVAGYEIVVFNPLYDLSVEGHASKALDALGVFCVLVKLRKVKCFRTAVCCLVRPFVRRCCARCAEGPPPDEKAAADQAKASGRDAASVEGLAKTL